MAFENLKLIYGTSEENSFIIKYFEDFYAEIMRLKDLVLHQAASGFIEKPTPIAPNPQPESSLAEKPTPIAPNPQPESALAEKSTPITPNQQPESAPAEKPSSADVSLSTPIENSAVDSSDVPSPERIISQLYEMLNNQAKDASRYGGEFAEKYFKEAQFVMAALADEIFLHINWSGKQYWENNLLESRLYNTHLSGETFFQRMDTFLKLRDPSRTDIAMVYLLALGLGFKGKYRNTADQSKIFAYKRELYIFINRRDPALFNLNAHMFPDAYMHTLEEGNIQYLNDWRPWVIIFLAIFAAMIIVSLSIWHINVGKTDKIITSIFNLTKK